jgi:hypothetical protein
MATPHVTGTVALCLYAALPSPNNCLTLAPAAIVVKLRTDAAARPPAYGFTGDPNSPNGARYYGYLVYAAGY